MTQPQKLAVLVSGTGSLLEAMINEDLQIDLILADRHCRGIDEVPKIAGAKGKPIETLLIPRLFGKEFNREEYTKEVTKVLLDRGITVIAMAGFMTFFSPEIFEHFGGKILNAHPSLLPSFKGDHAVRDALAFGVKVTGCTVHIATSELDAGPIISQNAVEVLPGDTVETLHERIKKVERVAYPKTVKGFMAGL